LIFLPDYGTRRRLGGARQHASNLVVWPRPVGRGHRADRDNGERFGDHRRRQAAAAALRELAGRPG
jgi:hypothetical protein